jgi:uncharacterized protein (TIGR03437 family)
MTMRTGWRTGALLALACAGGMAQSTPTVSAVMNAASYAIPGLPNAQVAQGSMFVIFGSGLGPLQLEVANPPLPRSLGGTTVRISSGDFSEDAYLFYTHASQVAGILPSRTPIGTARLTVTYRGAAAREVFLSVTARQLGLLARNQAGHGAATLQNYNSDADQPVNSPYVPARPGQAAILWGTGLGAIQADDGVTPPVGNLTERVDVLVGNKTVKPIYAGRSSQFPAIDQVNFLAPEGVNGCHVPLAVMVEGRSSNYVTMAIAEPGKTCADETGLGEAEMSAARRKGAVRVAVVNLGRILTVASGEQGAEETADAVTADFVERTSAELHSGAGVVDLYASLGSCYVYPMRSGDRSEWLPFQVANNRPLAAGPALYIASARETRTIPFAQPGSYSGALGGGAQQLFLEPGDYAVSNGAGGADVGPFQASLKIPAPITWTNRRDFARLVPRGRNVTLTWTGGDPKRECVFIMGASVDANVGAMRGFVCTERADALKFELPGRITGELPQGRLPAGADYPTGFLSVGTLPLPETAKFTAPGLDAGYLVYTQQSLQVTEYR